MKSLTKTIQNCAQAELGTQILPTNYTSLRRRCTDPTITQAIRQLSSGREEEKARAGEASHGVRPAASRRRCPGVQVLAHVPRGVELATRAAPAAPPPSVEAVRVPERVGVRIRVRAGVGEAGPPGGAARGEELGGARHGRARMWQPGKGSVGVAVPCCACARAHTDLAGGLD